MTRAAGAALTLLLAGTLAQTTAATAAAAPAAPALAAPAPGISTPAAKKIDRKVTDALAKSPRTTFLVQLGGKAPVPTAVAGQSHAQRAKGVYDAKRQFADKSQAGVRQLLTARKASFAPYWIANVVKVTGDGALVEELARRSDVAKILPNSTYAIPEPPKDTKPLAQVDSVEWNVANVRANEVWDDFGVTGDGIVIANIDTGVDFRHPALVDTYRGNNGNGVFDHNYNWFDPSNVCGTPSLEPCDNAGHGTHTMGTMVGDDHGANQIGVAPGATWIAAKGCESWSCSDAALLATGQWVVAPTDLQGRNPRPDLAPNIVNNSWGGGPDNPFYSEIVDTWVAAGIFPAFSIGNLGAGCDTAASPGDYPQSYGTGAYDYYGNIAYFSSRGPGQGDDVKPNISAPGVAVRSSLPGDEYQSWDGTSMASPHVAAAVALAWSAAPALIGDVAATRELLDETAIDTPDFQCGGTADDNNVYGEGKLDAYALVEASPRGPSGGLTGSVTSGGAPIAGATVKLVGPAQQTTRRTDELGHFRAPHLAVGEYTVTISKFAYLTQTTTVTIVEGQTTTLAVDLVPAPRSSLRGTVRQEDGSPVAFATVTVDGTPILPIASAWDGSYVFPFVAHGEYDVTVDFGKWLQPVTKHVVISADTTLDFVLPPKVDSYGYTVQPTWPQYVDAQTVLPLNGDDSNTKIELPFAFPYYGTTYRQATISTNGYLTFNNDYWSSYWTSKIPSGGDPNHAIYALWDDLDVDSQSSVRTQTLGTAPNRQFVVEWRNVLIRGSSANARLTVEVVLDELGHVTMQYKDLDSLDVWETGGSATVGIENANGTVGLQYSYNQIALHDAVAMTFGVENGGLLRGIVTDTNDGDPVAGATVRATRGDFSRETSTDTTGFYQLQLPAGDYTLTFSSDGYVTAEVPVTVTAGAITTRDIALDAPRLTVTPEEPLELVVPADQQRTRTLTLGNTGSAPAHWDVQEVQGGVLNVQGVANAEAAAKKLVAAQPGGKVDTPATTTAGFNRASTAAPPSTMAAGDVLKSWPAGKQRGGYGVGYDGSVWVSQQITRVNEKYTVDGAFQRQLPATYGDWMADMAFVPGKDAMCQSTIGSDNAIRCWNRDNGSVVATITGPWAANPQFGIAYRPDDDSFYVGSPWEGVIRHIAGLSAETPGAVLSECASPNYSIAGLAWSPRGILWQTTNSDPEPILGLNPDTCAVVQSIPDPDPLAYTGAGVELDESGNLWIVSQNPWGGPSTARLVETPVPTYSDVPWLSESPAAGTLAVGAEQQVAVTVDTTGLAPGVYGATILVNSDSPRRPVIAVPVKLVVPRYQTSIDAGATAGRVDGSGDTWRADIPYAAGGAGYLGTSTVVTSPQPVTRTTDPWLYETAREGAYEYRFDGVPNGTYQVDLDFAEIGGAEPNARVFDVTLERTLEIPGFDIVNENPPFAAKRESFTIQVTDGQLNVRLLARTGLPLVNGVRVTERPDLA
jgi:subtilisin family serine protease